MDLLALSNSAANFLLYFIMSSQVIIIVIMSSQVIIIVIMSSQVITIVIRSSQLIFIVSILCDHLHIKIRGHECEF